MALRIYGRPGGTASRPLRAAHFRHHRLAAEAPHAFALAAGGRRLFRRRQRGRGLYRPRTLAAVGLSGRRAEHTVLARDAVPARTARPQSGKQARPPLTRPISGDPGRSAAASPPLLTRRSVTRRVGNGCIRTLRSRWATYHQK